MACKQCGSEMATGVRFCENCGSPTPVESNEPSSTSSAAPSEHLSAQPSERCISPNNQWSTQAEHRYPILIFIAKTYKALAYLAGIVALIVLVITLPFAVSSDPFQSMVRWPILIYCITTGPLAVISLLAISETIRVFLGIEENTRRMAERIHESEA